MASKTKKAKQPCNRQGRNGGALAIDSEIMKTLTPEEVSIVEVWHSFGETSFSTFHANGMLLWQEACWQERAGSKLRPRSLVVIHFIYVMPDFQRQGIGTHLLSTLDHKKNIVATAVADEHHDFWKKAGFQVREILGAFSACKGDVPVPG